MYIRLLPVTYRMVSFQYLSLTSSYSTCPTSGILSGNLLAQLKTSGISQVYLQHYYFSYGDLGQLHDPLAPPSPSLVSQALRLASTAHWHHIEIRQVPCAKCTTLIVWHSNNPVYLHATLSRQSRPWLSEVSV
jgi:hypothetical protein